MLASRIRTFLLPSDPWPPTNHSAVQAVQSSERVQRLPPYPKPPPYTMTASGSKTIPIPPELATLQAGAAPRVSWLQARFGGVPLPLEAGDFVACIAAIRAKFDCHLSKAEANSLLEFGLKLHVASIEQAPHNDLHPPVAVPLEVLLFSKVAEFPSVVAAQGEHGGIPVPVEASDFEACSNLVASILKWAGKPTKMAATQFWTEVVDATEYPRLAGISVPPSKLRPVSIASAKTLVYRP